MEDLSTDKEMIGYCGLYCEECFLHEGKVADLSRDLRKELRRYRVDRTAESLSQIRFFNVFKDFPRCYEVLGALVKLRCRKGCREGGGNPFCKIRKCSQRKKFEGCWECDDLDECKKLDELIANHGNAHIKNLKTIKKKGKNGFLKGKRYWYTEAKK